MGTATPRWCHSTSKVTGTTAEYPITDQLNDSRAWTFLVPSNPKKGGRGAMRRRQFITKVATIVVPLVISTSAIAGAAATSSAATSNSASSGTTQSDLNVMISRDFSARLDQKVADLMPQGAAALDLAPGVAIQMAQPKVTNDAMFACIRNAESSDRWGITSGAYGILISSWWAFHWVWAPYGNFQVPGQAPAAVQNLVAYELYIAGGQGYGGWHDYCTGE